MANKKKKLIVTVFLSSKQLVIRMFHVVVMQWQQTNVQKRVMHVHRVLVLLIKPYSFSCSHCHCVSCLSSLMLSATRIRTDCYRLILADVIVYLLVDYHKIFLDSWAHHGSRKTRWKLLITVWRSWGGNVCCSPPGQLR